MPINADNYAKHGGNNVIVLWCRLHASDRLVHFAYLRASHGWKLRDYVGGFELWSDDSELAVADIEQASIHDEFPPRHSVKRGNNADWEAYLRLRTMAVAEQHGLTYSLTDPPNPASGRWRPIR